MITVNALLFPSSVANSLIAVGNDGPQERDRMVRACIAIICELGGFTHWLENTLRTQMLTSRMPMFVCAALENPEIVARRGGLSTILKNVIDCQLSRINEALITTILHLLNHPHTRQYVRSDVELEVSNCLQQSTHQKHYFIFYIIVLITIHLLLIISLYLYG